MNRFAFCLVGAVLSWCANPGARAQDSFVGDTKSHEDLSGDFLEDADFTRAKCFLTNFTDAQLARAVFVKADVTSATFTNADLTDTDFRGATVTRAGFQGANLTKAKLSGLDLTGASFQRSTLRSADLSQSENLGDVAGADLREANLCGANLRSLKNPAGVEADFTGATYDKATKWPDGFNLKKAGVVPVDDKGKTRITVTPKPQPKPQPRTVEEDVDDDADDEDAEDLDSDIDEFSAEDAEDWEIDELEFDDGDLGDLDDTDVREPQDEEPQAAEGVPPGAPSLAIVKRLIENEFWGPPDYGNEHTYRYKSFRYGEPYVDAAILTYETQYPIRVVAEIEVRASASGYTRTEKKDQTLRFFKDSRTGEWTLQFYRNH